MELNKIIGKKVLTLRGYKERKNQKNIEVTYILFDDKETFIYLEEQDYYSYHDCSTSARHIGVEQNKEKWNNIATNNEQYGDTNIDI